MKDGLASLDLLAIVRELQPLVGGYVSQVYGWGDEVVLKVHVPGAGRHEVYGRAGRWLCLREVGEKPAAPSPFAAALRPRLDNARIAEVAQRGADRIVTFGFEGGLRLVFELFGKGNVVLVEGGSTVACLRRARFRARTVAPGAPYDFPPEAADPVGMDGGAFAAALLPAKGGVVKALASGLNLGGPYAEEVCARAGVDKAVRPGAIGEEGVAALHGALAGLALEIRESPGPRVVFEGGEPLDATPVPFVRHAGKEARAFETFGAALSFLLDRAPREAVAEDEETAKLRRRLEEQRASLLATREEAARAGGLAELVYRHYASFDDLLRRAREGALAVQPPVLALDPERRVVRVSVADVAEVDLDWTRGVEQNAEALYGRRKEALAKAERVEAAIAETERELGKAERRASKPARERTRPTRRFWFEAYRWFLSSEGFLVIGGRDARSNDAVVKKHLKPGDRYVHADLRGAPSCVVKRGSDAGEATIREACSFALAWSKAWSAGVATGSAFVVNPEQVSKQAESGEYVARGAWVIRGKRTYVHDLPVRAAVGEIEHEGHRKVMAGPVAALEGRSERYAVLEPGEEAKEAFARRAARGFAVPVEELSRVLPPGGVRVAEARNVEL